MFVGAVTESVSGVQGGGASGTTGTRVVGSRLAVHLALSIRNLVKVHDFSPSRFPGSNLCDFFFKEIIF